MNNKKRGGGYVPHKNISSPTDFIELQMKKKKRKGSASRNLKQKEVDYSCPASQLTNGVKGYFQNLILHNTQRASKVFHIGRIYFSQGLFNHLLIMLLMQYISFTVQMDIDPNIL